MVVVADCDVPASSRYFTLSLMYCPEAADHSRAGFAKIILANLLLYQGF